MYCTFVLVQIFCMQTDTYKYKNMYACIMNIHVPHEVKYQHAFVKRTSQMM